MYRTLLSASFSTLALFSNARDPAAEPRFSPTNIFAPVSTPAHEINSLAIFVLTITIGIAVAIGALLAYALVRYRGKPGDSTEPPQVFGSTQIELAWTIIPVLLIVVLFLGTARVIFAVQDAPKPKSALDVIAIGHQFWWEFRYPQFNIVTANELHVPVSATQSTRPTFLKLTSADVMHSFWVPRLGGKTDLLPNRVNELWFDPQTPGLYLGQCAQFCGPEHAKMLLRVYVDTPAAFDLWVHQQQETQISGTHDAASAAAVQPNPGNSGGFPANTPPTLGGTSGQAQQISQAITPDAGRQVFEHQACINCHAVNGTVADGRYGPDLTHLMSRSTIAAGITPNTPENLVRWITDPNDFKPGTLMPAMHLTDRQNAQITAYLTTLR
ncbi:MAG: cytochrome c oxidase subunit II [Janthinobacterium lividum]